MGFLLILGAGLLGWKYGGLQPYRFLIIAVISAVLVTLDYAVNIDMLQNGMSSAINVAISFAVRFSSLAIPFALGAWIRMRGEKSRSNQSQSKQTVIVNNGKSNRNA